MLLNGVSKTGAAKRRVENRHSRRKGRSPSHNRHQSHQLRPRLNYGCHDSGRDIEVGAHVTYVT